MYSARNAYWYVFELHKNWYYGKMHETNGSTRIFTSPLMPKVVRAVPTLRVCKAIQTKMYRPPLCRHRPPLCRHPAAKLPAHRLPIMSVGTARLVVIPACLVAIPARLVAKNRSRIFGILWTTLAPRYQEFFSPCHATPVIWFRIRLMNLSTKKRNRPQFFYCVEICKLSVAMMRKVFFE